MDELEKALRRLDGMERNQSDVAKSITALIEDHNKSRNILDELRTDRAVRLERDKNLNERLDRIEASIARIHSLGRWVLAAFGAGLIALISNFLFRGGFNVV